MCRPDSVSVQQRNRSGAWLQRSLAIRTVSFVDSEIDNLLGHCRFLQQGHTCEEKHIARFRRRDIQIGRLLGKGGFSEVHQVTEFDIAEAEDEDDNDDHDLRHHLQQTAVDVKTGEHCYVIKHLKKSIMNDLRKFHSAAADLVLEAEFLSRLDHPNIIKLRALATAGTSAFGDGQHDGYFLILDHIDMDLSHRIQQWKDEEEACCVPSSSNSFLKHYSEKLHSGKQIASALDYLHQRDIMYRDLKPGNVGIKNGVVQLFDFGLCRELPEASPHSNKLFHMSRCGTRRYMSPEVAMGQGYNVKTDVYSLAVVLYEIMSLETPYETIYNREMHQYLVCEGQQRPEIHAEWPQDLQDLLGSGWTHEPSKRPTMHAVFLKLSKMADRAASHESSAVSGPRTPRNTLFRLVKALTTGLADRTSTTVLSNSSFDFTPVH
jgi:serine/threonine protein kinase